MKKNYKAKTLINKLNKDGYLILENVFSLSQCDKFKNEIIKLKQKLKAIPELNDYKKGQFILRDLILRNPKVFLKAIDNKKILNILDQVYEDKYVLDNIMASNSEKVKNFSRKIHIDQQLPTPGLKYTTDVVSLICLDDFELSNGATKIWPGSHNSGVRIHKSSKKFKKKYKPKNLVMKKGSVAILLGQLWHQVGRNKSNHSRWSIFLHYKRWWMKTSTDFVKCGEIIFKILNNKQKELMGFTSIPPRFKINKGFSELYTLRKIKKLGKNYKYILDY